MTKQGFKIFFGNSNITLVNKVCEYLDKPMGKALVSKFCDGEIRVQIEENVRGMDVFIIQSLCEPVNDNIMELLIMIDALKRASANRITAVIPYYGYARQDRKDQPRVPITAKLVADLITTAGADRVLTMELHAGQIQGFFNIPVDHLYANPVLVRYFKEKNFQNMVVISPDAGGVERARAFAKRLNAGLAIIDKRREEPNKAKIMHIIGDVEGRDALLLDDMIDTAGTIVQAAAAVREKGALRVYGACTHGVLSDSAIKKINESVFEEIIVTDTIPIREKAEACKKLRVLSISQLLGEAIGRIHKEESVNSLFV